MQPIGPSGMIRNYVQHVSYPTHMQTLGKTYRITSEQMGPRGRLPICPPSCFISGGEFPSNTLPNHTPPAGWGIDYYDTIKGDYYPTIREPDLIGPPPEPTYDEPEGSIFQSNTSDLISGDTKWFVDEDKNDWIVFLNKNGDVYVRNVDDPTKSWSVSLNATCSIPENSMLGMMFPPTTHIGSVSAIRLVRCDPKKSVIVNNHLVYIISVCDWNIRQGRVVAFTGDNNPPNCPIFKHYPADDATGMITGYNPVNKTFPELIETPTPCYVTADDSYRIFRYIHFIVTIDLNTKDKSGTPYPPYNGLQTWGGQGNCMRTTIRKYKTEFLSGHMDMIIQPLEEQQAIYFRGILANYNYSATGISNLGVYAPGTHTGSGHVESLLTPAYNGGYGYDVPWTGAPVHPTWAEKSADWPYWWLANPACYTHSYWIGHWHPPEPPQSSIGFAYVSETRWLTPPSRTNRTLFFPEQQDIPVSLNPYYWITEHMPVVPDEIAIANALEAVGITGWHYPNGPGIPPIGIIGDGVWNWHSCNWMSTWSDYLGPGQSPPDTSYTLRDSRPVWHQTGSGIVIKPGTDTLPKWVPYPFETRRYTRGREYKSEKVYGPSGEKNEGIFVDCLCSDTMFGDWTAHIGDELENNKTIIRFQSWGNESMPFPGDDDTSVDMPRENGDIIRDDGLYAPGATQKKKNNNPCIIRNMKENISTNHEKITSYIDQNKNVLFNGKTHYTHPDIAYWESGEAYKPVPDPNWQKPPEVPGEDTFNREKINIVTEPDSRKLSYWSGGTRYDYYELYDFESHNEVRPKNVWHPHENRKTEETGDHRAMMASADVHIIGTFGKSIYDDYMQDQKSKFTILGGSTSVGKHQQIIIPFKPKVTDPVDPEKTGDILFFSTLGVIDNSVLWSEWEKGFGGSGDKTSWCENRIYKGCLATNTITTPVLLNKSGSIIWRLGQSIDQLADKTFCKWAARADTKTPTGNWLIVAKQTLDYRGISPANDEEIEIITMNVYDYPDNFSSPRILYPRGGALKGTLSSAYALTPIVGDIDAWLFFCYQTNSGEDRLVKVSIINPTDFHYDVSSLHFYDQFIIEKPVSGSSKFYLYALCKNCGILDIFDASDLTFKKQLNVGWNTITSSRKGGIVGRKDDHGNPGGNGVKTKVDYYEYNFIPQLGIGDQTIIKYMPTGWR